MTKDISFPLHCTFYIKTLKSDIKIYIFFKHFILFCFSSMLKEESTYEIQVKKQTIKKNHNSQITVFLTVEPVQEVRKFQANCIRIQK